MSRLNWRSYWSFITATVSPLRLPFLEGRAAVALLLMLGLVALGARAQAPIQPATDSPRTAGETFWVDVTVGSSSAPVQDLFGTSFVLSYDASRVSVVGDEAGAFLGSDVVYQSSVDESAGEVDVGITRKSGAGGVNGDGTVARIKVALPDTAGGGPPLSFDLQEVSANDPSGAEVDLQPQGLEVDVKPAPPIRPAVSRPVTRPDTFGVDLRVGTDSVPVKDLFGTSFVLDYDETRLSVIGDEAGAFLGSDVVYQSSVDGSAGEVDVGVTRKSGAGGVDGSGAVARVRLAVPDTVSLGTELPLAVREVSASDPEGNSVVLDSRSTAVTVGKEGPPIRPTAPSETQAGNSFWIDVTVGTGSEEANDLFGASFTLEYDASNVSVVEDEAGSFLGTDVIYQSNVESGRGEIGIGVSRKSGARGVSGSGVVARVKMQVDSAPSDQTLSFDLSEVSATDSEGTPIALDPERLDVSIEGGNDVVARPDTFVVATARTLSVNAPGVLGNDEGASPTASVVTGVSEGSLTLNDDGSFEYTSDSGFAGTDAFTYEAASGGSSDQTTVTIEVQEPVASATETVDGASDAGSTVDFGDTGTSVTFSSSTSGSGEVSVDRFDEASPTTSGIDGNASEYRVEITARGDLSVGEGTQVRFDAGKLDGISDLNAVTIYTRETPGSGAFTELQTSYDEQRDELVATVSGFSEFAFGSQSEPLFSYPEEVTAEVSRSFGDASGPGDYRLVALPGQADRPLSDALPGEAGIEWQAYWYDGSGLVKYDGSETFRLEAGNGFWATSRQNWTASETVQSVDLSKSQATTVPLNGDSEWTIVSNPFDRNVRWSEVQGTSGLSAPLWAYDAEEGYVRVDEMQSAATGVAYYVLNSAGLEALTIPYPSTSKEGAAPQAEEEAQTLAISARPGSEEGPPSTVEVGLGEKKTYVAPPGQLEPVSLRIVAGGKRSSPDRPSEEQALMMARRPAEGSPAEGSHAGEGGGQTFSLRLTSRVEGPVEIQASGLGAIEDRSAALLHPEAGKTYDLREESVVTIEPDGESVELKAAIGTEGYVKNQADQVVPSEVRLSTYPNPMRQRGTVEYALPEEQEVRLEVYDVLGRRVATLEEGRKKAGSHTVRLETGQLSSGVYFGRLQAGGQTLTKKITVVR